MPQFCSHSHGSDLHSMGRALGAGRLNIRKAKNLPEKKTQLRQIQEWYDPI